MFNEEGDEDLELGQEEEPVNTDELNPVKPEELGDDEAAGENSVEDGDLEGEDLDDDEFGFDDEDDDLGDEDGLDDDDLGDDEDFDDDEEGLDDEDLDDDEFDFDDDDEDFDDEEGLDDEDFSDEDLDDEEGLDDEDGLGDEDDFSAGEDEDPEIELDENIVKKFRQLVRESINEMWDPFLKKDTVLLYVSPESDVESEEKGGFEAYDRRTKKTLFVPKEMVLSHNPEECLRIDYKDYKRLLGDEETGSIDATEGHPMNEAKAAKMNSIVESVVNDILNEDELHVFGDHPGYRKEPMTLPQTGEDKFQVNRDWNDDSVHSEEPFGKGKGDSTPFDQLVAQITDSVMKQINENKKKVK